LAAPVNIRINKITASVGLMLGESQVVTYQCRTVSLFMLFNFMLSFTANVVHTTWLAIVQRPKTAAA